MFTAGLVIGGAVTGLLAVIVGSLLRPALPLGLRLTLVAGAAAVVGIAELAGKRLPLPQNARQVPSWIVHQGRVGALQFGFEMGTGMRTFMPSALPHLALLTVLLFADLPSGLLAGVAFGSGRAAMTTARHRHPDTTAWDRHLMRSLRVIAATLAGVAISTVTVILFSAPS